LCYTRFDRGKESAGENSGMSDCCEGTNTVMQGEVFGQ